MTTISTDFSSGCALVVGGLFPGFGLPYVELVSVMAAAIASIVESDSPSMARASWVCRMYSAPVPLVPLASRRHFGERGHVRSGDHAPAIVSVGESFHCFSRRQGRSNPYPCKSPSFPACEVLEDAVLQLVEEFKGAAHALGSGALDMRSVGAGCAFVPQLTVDAFVKDLS